MDGIGKVILVREPQTTEEIVKGTGTGGIPDEEAEKDGMEMVFFEVSGPLDEYRISVRYHDTCLFTWQVHIQKQEPYTFPHW